MNTHPIVMALNDKIAKPGTLYLGQSYRGSMAGLWLGASRGQFVRLVCLNPLDDNFTRGIDISDMSSIARVEGRVTIAPDFRTAAPPADDDPPGTLYLGSGCSGLLCHLGPGGNALLSLHDWSLMAPDSNVYGTTAIYGWTLQVETAEQRAPLALLTFSAPAVTTEDS